MRRWGGDLCVAGGRGLDVVGEVVGVCYGVGRGIGRWGWGLGEGRGRYVSVGGRWRGSTSFSGEKLDRHD